MQSENLRDALHFLAERYQSYKDIQMTSSKSLELMQDSIESNLTSTRQELENLLDKYGNYLPKEVFLTLDESIANLQLLDSQLTEFLNLINKHLRIDDGSI